MEAIKIAVTGAKVAVENAPVITCGMVGVPVELTFDAAWDGLNKTLVYKAGGLIRDQMGVENAGTVPGEVLQIPYKNLQIGVYGASSDGAVVIPTVWAQVGQIQEGANPSGDPGIQPALPVWQQLLNRIETLGRPKLIWEMRVPGTAQGFFHTQNWCDEDRQFAVIDENLRDIPWNLAWWQDPELPADTTLSKVFESLFHNLKGHRAVCMEVEINGLSSMTGYPFYVCSEFEGVASVESLLLIVPNTEVSQTFSHDLVTVELRSFGLFNSARMGQLAMEYGWNVRVYAQEV